MSDAKSLAKWLIGGSAPVWGGVGQAMPEAYATSVKDPLAQAVLTAFPFQAPPQTAAPKVVYPTKNPMTAITDQDIERGIEMGLAFSGGGLATKGFKAYHGSPHDFDKFSLSKIGTGEGAQAYGHGLYFAENKGTARSYSDALAHDVKIGGKKYDMYDPLHVATVQVQESGSRAAAIKEIEAAIARDPGDPSAHYSRVLSVLKSGRDLPEFNSSGKMYEVNIKADPEHFLDWDKPLSQQPKAVQDYLAKRDPDMWHPSGADYDANEMGQAIYRRLHEMEIRSGKAEPAKIKEQQVTQALGSAGIPGIKYLDQGSRGVPTVGNGRVAARGDGKFDIVDDFGVQAGPFDTLAEAKQYLDPGKNLTRNYVVFDDKLIDILKKYGLAGMIPSAGLLASPPDYAGGT